MMVCKGRGIPQPEMKFYISKENERRQELTPDSDVEIDIVKHHYSDMTEGYVTIRRTPDTIKHMTIVCQLSQEGFKRVEKEMRLKLIYVWYFTMSAPE